MPERTIVDTPRYAFGPFVVDTANRHLARDGEPVAITARVFDILVALVERSGQPVDKDTLIGRVWGNVAVEEGNLARHVSTLRKVLGESPDDPRFVVTLPGRGYQFVAPVTIVDATATPAAVSSPPRPWLVPAMAAAAVAVVVAAAPLILMEPAPAPQTAPRIIVLPFRNMGPNADEYVAAGITEEVTSRLAMVQSLRVISRTTASRYERSPRTAREIGAELGADYLLEGSVLWDDPGQPSPRVRISAQLIRISEDSPVWADTFDRDAADVFAVQSEIALRVVREMRSTLLATERAAVSSAPTTHLDAYRSYLRGRFYASRPDLSEAGMAESIRHFQRASDLDAGFGQAHAALAAAHLTFNQFGYDTSPDRVAMARRALDRAKAAAPSLPETSRAEMRYWVAVKQDPSAAVAAVTTTEALRPHDPAVFNDTAAVFMRLGRWHDAAARLSRARELDPGNAFTAAHLALVLAGLHRYTHAQQAVEQSLAIERDQQLAYIVQVWIAWLGKGDLTRARSLVDALPKPDDWRFMELRFLQALYERRFDRAAREAAAWSDRWMRTWVLARPAALLEAQAWRLAGDTHRAAAAFDRARLLLEPEAQAAPTDGRIRSSLAIAYAGLGRTSEALAAAREALALMPFATAFDTSVVREDAALVATMVDEQELALREIETLLSTPAHFSVQLLRMDPRWDPLRAHARYKSLLTETRFSQPLN